MKLEVGMYVRTEDGYIFKIKELLEKGKYNDSDNKIVQRFRIDGMYQKNENYIETDYMYSDWIIKASHNIIDLIEVGDYVNGHKVYDDFRLDTDDFGIDFIEIGIESDKFLHHYIRKEDIKSIVTKEQFESISYKIGD